MAFASCDKRQQVTFKIDSLNPTKFNSLPRRKSAHCGEESFARNTPARRSAGHAERCVEYFVPRSLSAFNLSGAGDLYELAALAPRRAPRDKMVTFEDDRGAPPAHPAHPAPSPAPGAAKLVADDVFM